VNRYRYHCITLACPSPFHARAPQDAADAEPWAQGAVPGSRAHRKHNATRVDLALDKAFVIIDRQDPYGGMALRLPLNDVPNRALPLGT
jgi:hypothetical protein